MHVIHLLPLELDLGIAYHPLLVCGCGPETKITAWMTIFLGDHMLSSMSVFKTLISLLCIYGAGIY